MFYFNDLKGKIPKIIHIMLPKSSLSVKTKWMYFLIEYDDVLEKYNTIWDKVSADKKKNLITNLSTIKNFGKPK